MYEWNACQKKKRESANRSNNIHQVLIYIYIKHFGLYLESMLHYQIT